jgi:7-cyano-7-deazaguanine synthase in queuosine biosynthesis
MRADVQAALMTCLSFLTEDRWEFEFLPRRAARWDVEQQSILIDPQTNHTAGVMLYSGGLDSFAGLAAHLGDEHSEWALVSGVPNFRHKGPQAAQIAAARRLSPRHLYHPTVPYGLGTTIDTPAEEQSQRARSFLFLALGLVAADRIGADTLFMCENGVGAINLPLDGTQIGTSNARAAHPATLLRFNRLAQCLIGQRVRVRNPFWAATKGEACQHANVRLLGHAISETMSCDKFPLRVANVPQCGTCTSCLLRRVSLAAAGLQPFDKSGGYLRDVTRPSSRLRGHSLHGLQAMEWQFQCLSVALRSGNPWAALSQAFPDIRRAASAYQELEGLSSTIVRKALVRLYSEYAREWEHFPAREHLAVSKAA